MVRVKRISLYSLNRSKKKKKKTGCRRLFSPRSEECLLCCLLFIIGYATFFPIASDYDVQGSPRSWALVPSLRHAMAIYPHSKYFFSLSPHALIMKPDVNMNTQLLAPKRLEQLMLRDVSVVPPDSVIKTFSHLKGDKVDLVLTQDGEGLCQGSFIIRQTDWAKFFLDTWFDPLYRSYNFQKAEGHALVCFFKFKFRLFLFFFISFQKKKKSIYISMMTVLTLTFV